MQEWLNQNSAALIAAMIGVFGALLGVIITLVHENRQRKKEAIAKAKPIIINYPTWAKENSVGIPHYHFRADEMPEPNEICGYFKNTDNGILFLDTFESENKRYYSQQNSAVDKNSVFFITLHVVQGENLKGWRLYCHDIYDNKYFYDAKYGSDEKHNHLVFIGNIHKAKKRRRLQ